MSFYYISYCLQKPNQNLNTDTCKLGVDRNEVRCSDGLAYDLELILEVSSRDVHEEHSRNRGSTGRVEVNGGQAMYESA